MAAQAGRGATTRAPSHASRSAARASCRIDEPRIGLDAGPAPPTPEPQTGHSEAPQSPGGDLGSPGCRGARPGMREVSVGPGGGPVGSRADSLCWSGSPVFIHPGYARVIDGQLKRDTRAASSLLPELEDGRTPPGSRAARYRRMRAPAVWQRPTALGQRPGAVAVAAPIQRRRA